MAGKITELTALTGAAAADGDLLEVVDVSDTTMAGTGTNKKIALDELVFTQIVATQSGSTYTVVAADNGTLIRLTGTCTVTLPSGGPTAGQRVDFVCHRRCRHVRVGRRGDVGRRADTVGGGAGGRVVRVGDQDGFGDVGAGRGSRLRCPRRSGSSPRNEA